MLFNAQIQKNTDTGQGVNKSYLPGLHIIHSSLSRKQLLRVKIEICMMNFRVSQFLLFVYYFFFTKNSVQTDVYFCGISKTASIFSQSKLLHRGTLFGKHKYSYMSAQIALRLDFLTKICTWSLALPCRTFLIISLVQIDQI